MRKRGVRHAVMAVERGDGSFRWAAAASDTNYRLLIAIAERVSGMPLHRAFETELLRPVNLRQTWHPDGEPLDPAPAP